MAGRRFERFRAVCEQALAAYGCPSLSVAVVERGEVVWAEFGLADTRSGRAATPDTAYGLASVTKPFTATAVCRAADKGLLDLDAPVTTASHDGSAVAAASPTLRQLLAHRGGLAPYYDFHYLDERPAPRIDPAPYLTPVREPGTAFEYANLGYLLATRELERSTGREMAGLVREWVCRPLGLGSWRLGAEYVGPGPSAVRYTSDGRAYPPYTVSHAGATLAWATAADTALFAYGWGQLLDAGTRAAVLDAAPVTDDLGYGLGWCVSRGAGPRVLSHGGGGPGVAVFTAAVPELGLAVAVLGNSTGKSARDAVVEQLLGGLVPGFRREQISPVRPDPVRELGLEPGSSWAGSVTAPEGELPAVLTVRDGGRVVFEVAGVRAEAIAESSVAWALRADLGLQLPTADARLNSPRLGLALRRGTGADPDGTLEGFAHAYKAGDREGRLGAFLSHRCVLRMR